MSEPSDLSASTLARDVVNKYPGVQSEIKEDNAVELVVPAELIRDVVSLIDESISDLFPEAAFGVDLENDQFEVIYIFWSHSNKLLLQIRVKLEGENPEVDTLADIFPGMEWHERETHEMFGIMFKGHPDLRLLLLPDELEGKYPLRKSFKTDRSRLEESGLPKPKPRPPPKPEGGES